MHLRWRLCVVVGGGTGPGHEVCLRLARAGAGLLVVDTDGAAAESTAELARSSRVSAWSLKADPTDDQDLDLLAARARDLGGADLVVITGVDPARGPDVAARLVAEPRMVGLVGDDDVRVAVAAVEHLGAAEPGTAVVIG
ncbi:SDR family NAD(P)-dependent oxidoreductase [Nocardioides lianchengensis]|uniref:Short chain dehydrogenase n=1 Tax=Nocardioides lianchengensis TaxID=1045774 RepID=A0A1G6XXN9_9ACTN|nr:SDR family NAD(P)-dependent oxidoreductase [Nocardioides lianchengensis]NYG13466.1 NAD(P)-dependent dehydrogenase (short-subunit alcohol dehydrogenase family) [Nocardioides lianchengensis]SDD82443.1 short chain dehydrogenase [Nocardioides lianchengensis]